MNAITAPQRPSTPPGKVSMLDRDFERLFAGFDRLGLSDVFSSAPRMDMVETADGIELSVELPGATPEDVKIEVLENNLVISGETKSSTTVDQDGYWMSERRYGTFSRTVRLPGHPQADQITASMKDGVLTVTAPLDGAARGRSRSIPIKTA